MRMSPTVVRTLARAHPAACGARVGTPRGETTPLHLAAAWNVEAEESQEQAARGDAERDAGAGDAADAYCRSIVHILLEEVMEPAARRSSPLFSTLEPSRNMRPTGDSNLNSE